MDVHKKDIVVALLAPGTEEPAEWKLRNEPRAVRRLAKRLRREAIGELQCVYEAGPCGYTLQRQLLGQGIATDVVAPSLIPVKPGERIKTDRRDARKLAMAARAQMLTTVRPPTEGEEAVRDLCRCREDAREDLTRSRHRLSKMLMRRGFVYRAGRNWTQRHRGWLRALQFEDLATRTVFEDYLAVVEQGEERIRALESRLEEIAQEEAYRERVGWLRCFRGIDTVTAMTILAELHDFRRFDDPRRLMSYLGLVPSEHSSGE
jgi:transposase